MKYKFFYVFILVWISLPCNAQPSNDSPSSAIEMTLGINCSFATFSTLGATPTLSVPEPGCGGNAATGDVWFTVTSPAPDQNIVIELGAVEMLEAGLAIYSGTNWTDLNLLTCQESTSEGVLPSYTMERCGYPNEGETFWIRVWGKGSVNQGEFNICAYAEPGDAVTNLIACGSNDPFANTCCQAQIYNLCELDGFCSQTNANYSSDNGPPFCAIIDNNSWVAFIASSPTVQFHFEVNNCNLNFGIHAEVYQSDDCVGFTPMATSCFNPGISASSLSGSMVAENLVVGDVYYLMADGWAGDFCDFTVTIESEPLNITVSADDEIIDAAVCEGGTTQLSVDIVGEDYGDFTYSWSPASSLQNPDTKNPIASPTVSTVYTVTVSGHCGDYTASIPVDVVPLMPPVATISGESDICGNSNDVIYSVPDDNANTFSWTIIGDGVIDGAADQDSVVVDWGSMGGQICVDISNPCDLADQSCFAVTIYGEPDITVNNPTLACGVTSYDMNNITYVDANNAGGGMSFYATEADAMAGTSPLASAIVTISGTYWVRVATSPDCYDTDFVNILFEYPGLTVTDPAPVCMGSTIDLANVTYTEDNGFPGGTVSFYTTLADANADINSLTNTEISSGTVYYIRYETPAGCADIKPVNVSFEDAPNLLVTQPVLVCNPTTVDLSAVVVNDVNGQTIVSTNLFSTLAFAENGDPSLALSSPIVNTSGSWFIRQETATGCYDIAEIIVEIEPEPQASMSGGGQVCIGGGADLVFHLTGEAPYDVVFSDGTTNYTLYSIPDGHVERMTVMTTTDFYLVSHSDAVACAGNVDATPVQVATYDAPVAAISGALSGCPGDMVPLTFNFTGDGPFNVDYTYNGANESLTNIVDGHVEMIPVIDNESISLVSVSNMVGCSGTGNSTVTVSEIAPIQIINYSETCNNSYSGYTVNFEIIGGDPASYTVDGSVNGTLSGNVFTSDEVASLVDFNLTIDDDYGCSPMPVSGMLDCSCTTSSGTMVLDGLGACEDGTVEAIHNGDGNLNAGDVLLYVLHDGDDAALGTNIFTVQSSNIFTAEPGMQRGVLYYISAMVGPPDGTGGIDQTSPCFGVAPGQPVAFYEIPEGNISGVADICNGESAALTFNFSTGTGPFDVVYTDDYNNQFTLNGISDGHIEQVMPSGELDYTYTIVSITDNTPFACSGMGTGTAEVTIMDSPLVGVPNLECNATATEFQVTFEISGGDPTTYAFVGDGTFNSTNNMFTSSSLPTGTDFYFEISDINDCDPFIVSGNHACNCITNIGAFDLTPLELCEDELAAPIYNGNEVLDPDDVLRFILHDGDSENIGNILLDSATPQFSFDPGVLNYDTPYVISAVAGNDDGTGMPHLNTIVNPCLAISEAVPVIFYQTPEIMLIGDDAICDGDDTFLTFEITGTGPFDVEYTDGTSNYFLEGINSGHTETLFPSSNKTYTILSCMMATGSGCDALIDNATASNDLMVIDIPEVINFGIICDSVAQNYVITFEIQGGDPATYTVMGTPGILTGNSFTSTVLAGGQNYNFTVDDDYHCNPQTLTGMELCGCDLTIRPLLTITHELQCGGDQDGRIEVTNMNGVPPFSFRWDNGVVGTSIDGLGAGWYSVTMTDGELCETVDSVLLDEPTRVEADLKAIPPSCYGEPDAMIYFDNVRGGMGLPYMYALDSIYVMPDSTFHNMESGKYLGTVTDANGCSWQDTVMIYDPDQFMVSVGDDMTIQLGESVSFEVMTSGVVDTFYWSDDTQPYIPCLDCPYFEVVPMESLTYKISAINDKGCVTKASRVIYVEKAREIYIPSAFSPNNDGVNDMFTIYGGKDIERIKDFKVFSRWGGLIFGNSNFGPNNPEEGWSGKIDGKVLQPGTFVYFTEVEFKDGSVEIFQGDITLVR